MTINLENEYENKSDEAIYKFHMELMSEYERIVKDVIEYAIDYVECPYECEVDVIFTDNAGIHEINKENRDIDRPTDVLSFPLVDYKAPQDFSVLDEDESEYFNYDTGELMLGSVIISLDKVKSQAEEYGHSPKREIAFLTAHSMLHLFGHDHMTDEERIVMEKRQYEILDKLGYTRDYV